MSSTVLVTGISGFIAKHIGLRLLENGFRVRGSVRDLSVSDDVRNTLKSHGADVSGLTILQADLESDAGWTEAATGCEYVMHTASPFPLVQPRDRYSLVPAARDGALRIMEAARLADVKRVVFTSSLAAMTYRPGQTGRTEVHERDWTDVEWPALSAYQVSKTHAEQSVWEWTKSQGWLDRITVVNPGFVLGPALDERIGTSLRAVQLMMRGAYPVVPPVHYPVVDVRDLAMLHLKAMTEPGVVGRRLIGAGETLSMSDMGRILRAAFPDRKKIPYREVPAFLVRLMSTFDRSLKSVISDLGIVPVADSAYVTELTGVAFRPAEEAVRSAADSLVKLGLVD